MIAVLPDEASAFRAYMLLQRHGISPENLALVGRGYSSPESVGLVEPGRMAWKYARYGMIVTGAVGVAMGVGFQIIVGLRSVQIFFHMSWSQTLLVVAIASGLVGSLIGALVGSLYGLFYKSSTSIACRNCLRQGQYLLLLEGSETLTRKGREILNNYLA
jgi:hypothetical protein